MIMTIIASGKREFIPRTSYVPATSREVGTVARVTAEVPWSFPSMEGFKSSVSSVGASDVLGRDQTEAVMRDNGVMFTVYCFRSHLPGVYTNVAMYIDWIAETLY